MIELPLVFLAGLLGSGHCVGMCGGFAMLLALGSRGLLGNLGRQLAFGLGRMFTYAFLGVTCVHLGQRLNPWAPSAAVFSGVVSLLAGGVLIHQGIRVLVPSSVPSGGGTVTCLAGTFVRSFLTAPGLASALLAGVFTGLLPCGLVYGMLALAAGTGSVWIGGGTMLLFGLGTLPIMVATGCGGALIQQAARRRLYALAAWCVVAIGLVSLARGASRLRASAAGPTAVVCPWCP